MSFYTALNQNIKNERQKEWSTLRLQAKFSTFAYPSRELGLQLGLSFLAHLIKLIKHTLLFAALLTRYILTLLYNPKEYEGSKDKISVALKSCLWNTFKLMLTNFFNMLVAVVSPFVRAIKSLKDGYELNDVKTRLDKKLNSNTWTFASAIDIGLYQRGKELFENTFADNSVVDVEEAGHFDPGEFEI